MAGERREATEAAIEASLRQRLVHAGQHRLKISARWREPTSLVWPTEITQVTILDPPTDRSALCQAEAFPLQADIEFAVVPCFEAFLGRQRLQASEDPILSLTFLHKRGPVADERGARWIEVALQAGDPSAS